MKRVDQVEVSVTLREFLFKFPLEDGVTLDQLRESMTVSRGRVNNRIQQTLKLGLIERVGYAVYRITDLGNRNR